MVVAPPGDFPGPGEQFPSSTTAPWLCTAAAISAASRDLPAPGSPPMKMICRPPARTAAHASSAADVSAARPTNTGIAAPATRIGYGGASQAAMRSM